MCRTYGALEKSGLKPVLACACLSRRLKAPAPPTEARELNSPLQTLASLKTGDYRGFLAALGQGRA
jgi:hypothetical protein